MRSLTFNQQVVLDAIMNDPGLTVAEIADETELTEASVRTALAKLEGQGLILLLGSVEWADARFVTRTGMA